MSTREVVAPVWRVDCDYDGCDVTFTPPPTDHHSRKTGPMARMAAKRAGWQVRPLYGRGSRTAPDLCPKHKEPER